MKTSKRIISLILVVLMAFSLNLSSAFCTAFAADGEEASSPAFSSEYSKVGEPLSVVNCSATASYKWYVDGNAISNTESNYTPVEDDLEKFIKVEVYEGENLVSTLSTFCSELPVVYINTEDGQRVTSKDDYINSEINIQGNDTYNSSNTTLYSGASEIKGHGNSTWKRFDKKSYKLKLDKKTDLFGMGKSKHWLLIANYIDTSLLRNATSVELAKIFGAEYLDCTWVDVVFNGECIGNYQLYEQSRIESTRVDIFNWEDATGDIAKAVAKKEDLSDDDKDAIETQLTEDLNWMTTGTFEYNGVTYTISDYYTKLPSSTNGGYLFEIDTYYDELSRFKTTEKTPVMLKNPEYLYTNTTVMTEVQSMVQQLEDSFNSTDFTVDVDGKKVSYVELCDVDSMLTYFLSSDMLQSEAGSKSTYFYKDIDGKFTFGPIWDFDFSANNVAPFGATYAKEWKITKGHWFGSVAKDPYFAVKLRELFLSNYDELENLYAKGGTIDTWASYIKTSAENNNEIWPYSRSVSEDTNTLKTWLSERMNWISNEFTSDNSALESFGGATSSKLSLSVTDASSCDEGYYITDGKQDEITLQVNSTAASSVNYYINGIFGGTASFDNGVASVKIPASALTEEKGSKNVITARLVEDDGTLDEMQFVTITVYEKDTRFSTVTFIDGDETYTKTVLNNSYIVLEDSLLDSANTVVDGWNNGLATYKVGSTYKVQGNVTFKSILEPCADGSSVHDMYYVTDDGYYCANCNAMKSDDKEYVNVAQLSYTQSSRYNTTYTGREVAPDIDVSWQGNLLEEGKDYTIVIENNVNVGFATYTITGIKSAGYDGTVSLTYGIKARSISSAKVSTNGIVYYGKTDQKPEFTLTYNGMELVEGKDYTVTFSDNLELGYGQATVTGIGNFTGQKSFYLNIEGVTDLVVNKVSNSTISLTWSPDLNCDCYNIYRKDGKDGSYTKIAVINDPETASYTDESLKMDLKYYYKIICEKTVDGHTYTSGNNIVVSKTITLDKPVVTATASDYKTIDLVWAGIEGAAGYEVYSSATKSGTYKLVSTVTKNNFTDNSLLTGTVHYYKVRAFLTVDGVTVYSSYSSVVHAKPVLSSVTDFTAKNSSSSVNLTWSKVKGAQGYVLYRSTTRNGTYSRLAKVSQTSYTDSKVTVGTTYYYKIIPYVTNTACTCKGAESKVVSAKAVLGSATDIKTKASSSGIKLTWSKVKNAQGYILYRSTTKNGTYSRLAKVSQASYTDSKVIIGTTYYYKIIPYVTNTVGTSKGTASKAVSVKAVLSPVSDLKAKASSSGVKLTWSKVKNAQGYILYRSTTKNGTYSRLTKLSKSAFTDTEVSSGKTYYYKIIPYITNTAGTSKGTASAAVSCKAV